MGWRELRWVAGGGAIFKNCAGLHREPHWSRGRRRVHHGKSQVRGSISIDEQGQQPSPPPRTTRFDREAHVGPTAVDSQTAAPSSHTPSSVIDSHWLHRLHYSTPSTEMNFTQQQSAGRLRRLPAFPGPSMILGGGGGRDDKELHLEPIIRLCRGQSATGGRKTLAAGPSIPPLPPVIDQSDADQQQNHPARIAVPSPRSPTRTLINSTPKKREQLRNSYPQSHSSIKGNETSRKIDRQITSSILKIHLTYSSSFSQHKNSKRTTWKWSIKY